MTLFNQTKEVEEEAVEVEVVEAEAVAEVAVEVEVVDLTDLGTVTTAQSPTLDPKRCQTDGSMIYMTHQKVELWHPLPRNHSALAPSLSSRILTLR